MTVQENRLRVSGPALKDGPAKVDGGCLLKSGGEVSLEDVTLAGNHARNEGGGDNYRQLQ